MTSSVSMSSINIVKSFNKSHLFRVVKVTGELSLLRQLSVLGVKMMLPNATSIGYRQLTIS
ncbi:hypothetical protein, partial [Caldivirga sp.]|uniref:hypothetical protein n=1 Tax=Caldivirga sp. TaxID=2080243 RepID=UPI0025C28DB2